MPDALSPDPTPQSAPIPLTTAIAVVLDETGSMEVCRDAAIAGFNNWLTAQQEAVRDMAGATTLTLAKFSQRPDLPMCRLVHEGMPLTTVGPLHRESYTPDGGTPLLDAVGRTIMWMDRLQPTPERTLVVILTDGEENASREFTPQQIRDLIRSREATGTWTFVYLAANQDALAVGGQLGISAGNTASFHVGEAGAAFHRTSMSTARFLRGGARSSSAFWTEADEQGEEPAAGGTPSPPTRLGPRRRHRTPVLEGRSHTY
jgi:hypothetical protein